MKNVFGKFALALIIALLGGSVSAQQVALPDLGGTSTRLLPIEQEKTFARDFERYLRSHNLLVEDPMITDYFEDMGFRLVAHSSRRDASFHFFVLRDPGINAFASVAGVIGINAGLILLAHEESEVAGVVAHEIAHVTQDHLARGFENQQQVSLPVMLATLGLAIAAGAAGASPDASQALVMSGMGLAQQFQINHTRQAEAEADRVGIGLLARAGYDPHGMTHFFERLNVHSRAMGQGPPEYLRTHPLTVNRIAEARSRAEGLAAGEARNSIEFHFIQSRLRVQMSEPAAQSIDWFESRLRREERPPEAMRYGLALAQIRARRFDEARDNLEQLLAIEDRQIYRLLEGELLMAEGRIDEAIATLGSLYEQFPGSRMVTTLYAEALMHERDSERAELATQVLRRHLQRHPTDLRMTELFSRAADRAGHSVRAAESVAESYYLRGGVREAIDQLERLTERDDLDYYQRARINARLNELRSEHLRMVSRGR